jgi:hypothetical protein
MEEMPSQNMPVQRQKATILLLDLTCFRLITHLGKILTTDKSLKKMPEGSITLMTNINLLKVLAQTPAPNHVGD